MKRLNKVSISIFLISILLLVAIMMTITNDISSTASASESENIANLTSDAPIPEIDEAKLPTSTEEKARFENITKNAQRNLEDGSIKESSVPKEFVTFPSDVSYSNPNTGVSTFGTGFDTGDVYNGNIFRWKIYSFYLPVSSYVYTDISGSVRKFGTAAYYYATIDNGILNTADRTESCPYGEYCALSFQMSRLVYLTKGWHTLYLEGYTSRAIGYISIIAQPEYTAITVTSPNGGETWTKGATKSITWKKDGQPGANVKIELYKAGVLSGVISSTTANDEQYSWRIPTSQPIGTDYKIKITSTSESTKYYDWSDNYFKIN